MAYGQNVVHYLFFEIRFHQKRVVPNHFIAVAAFLWYQQSRIVATETMQPAKLKIFTIRLYRKRLLTSVLHQLSPSGGHGLKLTVLESRKKMISVSSNLGTNYITSWLHGSFLWSNHCQLLHVLVLLMTSSYKK